MHPIFIRRVICLLVLVGIALPAAVAASENVTTLEPVVIDSGGRAYIQFEIWVLLFILLFVFLFHSWVFEKNIEITALFAFLFSAMLAWLTGFIEFHSVQVLETAAGITVVPVSYVAHPVYITYLMIGLMIFSIINVWRAVKIVYFPKVTRKR